MLVNICREYNAQGAVGQGQEKSSDCFGGLIYFPYLCHRYDELTKSYTQMKQVLLMAVLAAGLLLAGCSKEDNSEELENRNNMEQTNALTKEQIVGVWRNGDYWVSFAEDGFMCGYLSEKCIVEGGYQVLQDQVIVVSDFFENNISTFKITSVTNERLTCDVKYSEIEGLTLKEAEGKMAFAKSQELPTPRNSEITGKGFEYKSFYILSGNFTSDSHKGQRVECLNHGDFRNDGSTFRMIDRLSSNGQIRPSWRIYIKDFYVYLYPNIYFIEYVNKEYNEKSFFYDLHPFEIQKMEVYFDIGGKVVLK